MSAGYCSNVNLRTEYSKLDKYIDKNAADSIENTSLKACFGSPEYKQLIEERGINDKTSPKKAFEVLKEVLAIKTKNINAINNIGIENSGLFSSKEAKVQAIDYLSANIYLKYKDSVYNGKPATFIETITGLRNNIRQIAAIKMLATSDNADAFKERLKNAKTEAETNIILSDLAEDIKENKIAYNIYAMYKSMYDTDFIRELIDTKNVSNVFTSKDINYEELDSQLDGDFNTEDDLFNDDSDETDKSTLAWNNAIGEKTNFTQHVEELVKLYLMTIPMLNSTDPIITKINGKTKKVWNVKRNSELGLPIYADAQKLMNVLYTNTDNSNCENFIKSIKAVANKKPKLKALAYIADMLESNKDLANKFYMVFNHPVAVKKAAMIDRKGNVDYAQTNSNIFEVNVIVDSIVSNIKSATEESIEKAKNILSKDNVSNENIVDAIKIICPNLDIEEITVYVKDGNHALSRAKMFVNIAYKTIKARAEYNKNVINGRKADADNIVQGFDFIKSFAKEYAEYADVNTSLNHKNVEGKQASDVINNSYLFYVKDMLNSKELSDIYAKQKFIGNDYNYSNILIERVSPTGELMPGLFRYDEVKQEYVITEYANDIFDVSLFDGILNKNNNEGYTYGSMYNGDYLLASLIAYSKRKEIVINTNEGEQVVTVADFFNSIPSDAPKNFVITMPVMSINGLYTNPLIDKTVDDFENKMNTAEINDKPAIHNITINTSLITSEYTKKIINGDMIETLPIQPNGILAVKKGDNINYRFFVKDEFNIKYEITGTIVKQNNNIYLNDVKLVSIIKDASTSDIVFNSNINVAKTMYKKLVKNEAARDASLNIKTIDINHPIVNAIRNIIYQEILDAYTEARKVFKTDANDNIKFDNLTPVYIDNFNIDSVYGNYGKKGNAIIKKDGAKYKLTGNVYKMAELDSDNAVLNKYYNLLGNDKIFDVLYGRGDSKIVVKDGKLIPNAKQEAAINEAIDEFLHSYLNNATAELRKTYGTFVKNTPIAELGEFLINRFINGVNMDNMFNGKSKYYKNPQTVLKRSKQVQAGGNSFGNTDLTINCLNYGKATNDNPIVVNGRQVIVEGHAISTHNVFTGITINNTIKYSNNETINMLREKIDNSNVSEEVKERVLTPFGYVKRDGNTGDKTVVNDAQSYITFDEWIRRIAAAGELHKYASLIEALTNNIPIENIDWSKIPNNIQIQKNFYYDLHRENPNSPEVPRQIKNAEFVLVPKLIKGTELMEIYNAMIANGIDQINTAETSKAAEHNIATLWDVNTGELKLDTFNEKAAIYKQYYSYNYLYRQQEVPEHTIEAKNKAGIQIFKKILDNIPDNDEKGQELKNKLFTYYTAQIKQSFLDIVAELNLPIDKNGNLKVNEDGTIDGLSLKVLLQKAKENAIRQNANRVVIEMFTEAIDGLAKYPLFNNNSGTKIENIINSLFNRGITRQTIAGWHAAQLSDFGFKKLTDKINTTSDGKLKYIQKGTTADGTPIYYAEIRLKRWSNALYKNIKDTNGNIKRIPIPIEEVPEEAKTMIGYRIPTEGKQSIVVMKVVEFLDDAYGSTVVVPDEWVTQSGSDFDVDSIYAMNKTLYQDKNGNVKVNNEDRFTKDEKGYINYVNAYMDRAARTKLKEYNGVLNDTISQIKDIANADREQLNESYKEKILEQINKAFEAANNISELAKDEDSKKRRANLYLIRNAIGRKEKNVKMKVYIDNVLENLYALEHNEKFMKDEWAVDILKAQYDIYGELQELFDKQVDEISDSYNNTSDNIKQAIEDSNEAKFEISENYAKENGLMSYAQYVSSPVEDRIDSDARNNAIVQTFIDILQQPFAYEENMGRSHFDNVVDSIKKWGELYDNYINGKINNINNNTNQNITNNKINITNSTYTKETPINNPNTNFVFTENAQAYMWANEYYNVNYIFPYKPTLNVSSSKSRTNQAVIRTSPTGELNKNAFGLVVKKYQQNSDGVFVMEEGFFKDTDEDFALFTTLNEEMFDRLAKDNKPIVFPSSVAMGKAALPKRFADWLQNELKVRFNINSDIKTNGNGYGLELNNVINDTETAIQTHNDLVNDLGGDKIAINEIKDAVKIAKEGLSFDEVLSTVNDYNDNSSIAKANNIKDNTNERGNLGGHDFLTQLAWKESAGSGIKIKAISVNLDTGASICNVAKGTLPVSIKVRYDNLNNENVAKSYGNDFDSKTDIVKHNKIGWSNDNKNVVGELITPYSSQTTAHILDVMKSGAIHNENIFTFNSFKLLLNIGVDYDTAIGFLHQPAIDLLVKNWSLTQSVNAEDTSSALWNTISDMAKRIGIDSKGSVDNIIAKYVNQYEARLKERYNSTEPYFYSKYFEERLNGSMSAGEELLHDFETLMLFVELNKQAELFNKTLRVLTSDKFGAKQTFYETDKIFRDIEKLRTAEESSIGGIDKNGNATTLIDAIYPNIENGYNNINVSDSAYPTLAAMLKYASYTSVVVDSTVFDTNKKNFTDIIYNLAKFTRYGNIDKQLYKQYKEYLIHNLYSIDNDNNSVLVNPIVVNNDGTLSVYQSSTGLSNSQVKSDEINRIIGINKTPNAENTFTVGNILRPTEAEIKEFATLSVGQKVLWIKNNITGDTIFDYIDVNMFNEFYVRKGYNPNVEYITSVRGDISDNALFDLFDKCYYSNNPLIKMAAIDLVKYAYIVEGNRYNYNNVSRVITNAPFNDYQDGGLNLGTFIKDTISSYNEVTPDSKYSDELAIGFIRQNMDSFKFKRVSMKKVKSDKILKNVVNVSNNGTITLDLSVDDVRKEAIKLGFGPLIEVKIGNDYKTYMGKTDDSGCLVYVPLEPLAKSDIGIYLEPSNVIHNNNYTSYSEAAKQREINARDINIYASYDAKYNLATAKRYKLPNTKEVANDIANHDFNKHPIYIIKDKFRNTEPIVVENELEGGKAYVVIPVDAKTINNYKTSDLIDDTNKAMITNYANMNFDNTCVVIRETKSDVKFSTIGSEYSEELFNALLETNKVIESANERGDTKAKAVMQKYNKSSINFRNEESVKGNIGAIISANEDFIKTEAYELLNKVNNFMVVDGNNLGINRNEVIEAVFKNDTLENEFIELVLKMVSFKKKYNLIQHIDVDSVDDEIKDSLKTIQSVINNVANNPKIIHAKRKYMNEFIRQNSTNPNVASDLQTAFDIYGDTSQADYLIQDIKFNRNPIIQAFVKESAAIVQEANMRSKQEAMEFENEFNKLVEEARNNGKSISFNKMIKDGRFVNKENQAWHDKHDELWNDYIKAVDETKSTTSIEALKALHKFKTFKYITTVSKFKAIDIPATPTGPATHYQYDNEMLTIERYMLYGTKNDAPELVAKTADYYSKYKELLNQQRDVLSNVIGGILNDEQEQKMNEIYSKINTLVNLYDSDGNKKIGNDYLAAERLAEAIKRIKEVKLVYFDKTVKEGFEIQLKNNLAIIDRYEIRDELGNLIVPIAVLMNNEEYKKAKQWIRFNARYILPKDFDENLKKAHAALADSNTKNSVYSTIVREINPRDEYGIIDGTKFSKEQVDKIREDYYKKFDVHGSTNEPYIGIVKTYNPGKYAYNSKFRAEFNNINKAQGTLDDIVRIGMLINNILKKGFDNANRVLHTSSANFTIDDLKTLKLLIEEYHSIRSGVKNKKAAKFISEKCKVVYDESSYNNDRRGLADKSDEYKELWHEIFEEKEINEITGEVTIKPAMMFYGSIHPKDEYLNDYVDWDKTNAIAFLNEFTREVPTHYYKDTLEAKRKELSPEEFKQWYLDNHVYDPYTRTFKPLRIWLHTEYIDETGNKFKGLWEPRVNQTDSSIKKEFENTEEDGYVEGSINYKEGSYFTDKTTGNKVSTDNEDYKALNEYEIKAIELMKEYINKYAFSRADKSFIQNGYLPSVKYNAKFTSKDALKEAFSFFGFSTNIPSDTKWRPIDDIEFNKDTELNNPMLRKIIDAASAPRKGVPQFPNIGESESDFLVRKQAIIEENKAIDAANAKFHADNINTNWMEVMKAYITNGVKLNASRVIKNKLYFADDALLSNKAKQLNYKNELIIDDDYSEKSEDGLKMYKTVSNANSSKALRNYIRRIVFNQYKDNSNPKLLAIGNLAQNVAGSKYMMLNVTGGIANFLTGQVNIGMERVAKEYFTTKDYIVGQNIYMSGITSYLQNMFSDTSTSLPDAIIKLANIVDYDRIAELTDKTARGIIKKVRGLSFSPQTMTEHAMQNTVLLAMMKNHKVITDNEGTRIMSREMYMRNADKEALFEVINDELKTKYNDMIESIKKDEARKAKYNMFRNNIVQDFVNMYLTKEQKLEYIAKRKEITNKRKAEFDKQAIDVYSQFELSNGYAVLKADAVITLRDFAEFTEKVKAVNKHIHGVYDKIGSALIENQWFGGMVMQFHKHLYPGFKKRYRNKYYYDEQLETIQGASYTSLIRFLKTPIDNINNTDEEAGAIQGIKNYVASLTDFVGNISIYYNVLPENEKANIRRNLADMFYVGVAIIAAIALTAAAGDDDEVEESIWYNLLMYHADRLASEAFAFNPIGLTNEGKKLWSSPVAIMSSCNDLLSTMSFAVMTLVDNDFENTYATGRFAGEDKVTVMFERNIPVWRNINRLIELPKNNSYYKVGKTGLSFFPIKDIAHFINPKVDVD